MFVVGGVDDGLATAVPPGLCKAVLSDQLSPPHPTRRATAHATRHIPRGGTLRASFETLTKKTNKALRTNVSQLLLRPIRMGQKNWGKIQKNTGSENISMDAGSTGLVSTDKLAVGMIYTYLHNKYIQYSTGILISELFDTEYGHTCSR